MRAFLTLLAIKTSIENSLYKQKFKSCRRCMYVARQNPKPFLMTILRFGNTEAQLNRPSSLAQPTKPSSTPHVVQIAPCNNSGLLVAPGVQLFSCKTLKCSIFYIALGASRHFLRKQASCQHVMYRSSIVLPFPLIKTLPGNAGRWILFDCIIAILRSNMSNQNCFQMPSHPTLQPSRETVDLLSQVW